MPTKLIFKNLLLGFFSWLIPFAVSFLFYKPGGELVVPYGNFKAIITVVGTLSGCYLLYRYFMQADGNYIRVGILVGWSWFLINIVLDAIILIPIMKTSFAEYFASIGLSYLSIPVISTAMGFLLERRLNPSKP